MQIRLFKDLPIDAEFTLKEDLLLQAGTLFQKYDDQSFIPVDSIIAKSNQECETITDEFV